MTATATLQLHASYSYSYSYSQLQPALLTWPEFTAADTAAAPVLRSAKKYLVRLSPVLSVFI
jgi:hypothetical protein